MNRHDLDLVSSRGSLFDAMAGVRPRLQRSGSLRVSVDGGAPTDLSILTVIRAVDVSEVRLLRASRTMAAVSIGPNGDIVAADVIQVFTRRQ